MKELHGGWHFIAFCLSPFAFCLPAAGGSADRGSRVAQKFLAALPDIPSVTVSNRQGGGGTLAWTEDFRNSAEARKHLDAESEFLRKILVELGVLTR